MTDNSTQWGISGIIFPWAICDATGEVTAHGTLKVGYKHGLNPANLGEFSEQTERIGSMLKDLVLRDYGALENGQTFERISIEEHQQLERDDAAKDEDDEDYNVEEDS